MKRVLLAVVILSLAASANAGCLKCDQTTGWWCFMSTFGTKANCDSPTGAGCFTWGTCGPSACDYDSCMENVAVLPFNDSMRIASVSVAVPLRRS